jgi:hypothetical protein
MQTPLHPLLSNALLEMPSQVYGSPRSDDAWSKSTLSTCADTALIESVIDVIARPKRAAPSSFVLHAPLELLARARLLPLIDPSARDAARRRIAEVATRYAAAGEEVAHSAGVFATKEAALDALKDALNCADSDAALASVVYLSSSHVRPSTNELRRAIVDWVLPQLGAAGHAPILLATLPSATQRFRNATRLLCAPIYYLAGSTSGRMTWFTELTQSESTHTHCDASKAMQDELCTPPPVKSSSTYIAPTLFATQAHMASAPGFANACAMIDVINAERVLLRIAALSMLHDDDKSAPYGWTHCLTLPQAVLQNRDAANDDRAVIAMAASYVYAFRATLSTVALTQAEVANATKAYEEGLPENRNELKRQLATRAAIHHDAHLAKYTLACFDAASTDLAAEALYLHAARRLSDYWERNNRRQESVMSA